MTYYEILGLMTETYCRLPTTATTIGVIQECAKIAYEIIQKNSPTDKESLDVAPIVDKAIDLGIAVEQERVKKSRNLGGDDCKTKKEPKVAQMTQKKRETSGEFAVPNLSPREQKLYDFLQENPDATTEQMMEHLGVDIPQAVYVAKSSLKAKLNLMKPLKDRK